MLYDSFPLDAHPYSIPEGKEEGEGEGEEKREFNCWGDNREPQSARQPAFTPFCRMALPGMRANMEKKKKKKEGEKEGAAHCRPEQIKKNKIFWFYFLRRGNALTTRPGPGFI